VSESEFLAWFVVALLQKLGGEAQFTGEEDMSGRLVLCAIDEATGATTLRLIDLSKAGNV
jgi:hypothetical protein